MSGFRSAPLSACRLVLICLACALPGVTATAARAAFPGANGRITFTRCDSSSCNDGDLWSIAPDGSTPLQLTSGANYDEASSYSADGKRIVFERCDSTDTFCAISVMNTDGTGITPLTDSTHSYFEPDFSPSGALIAFYRATSGGDPILTVSSGGGAVNPLTPDSGEYDQSPRFSPDGSKIVFERLIPTVTDSIWIMNADGSDQHALTHQPTSASDRAPDWSPDGAHIIFNRYDPIAGEFRIWVMNADGSGAHKLEDLGPGVSDEQANFSPDGTKIAFVRYPGDGSSPIEVMNADGTGAAVLTKAGNREYGPSWQPVAPVLSGAPTIAGTAINGQTLTAAAASAVGGGSTTFQWLRCDGSGNGCIAISGAAAGTYALTSGDIGHAIRVRQTQTNAAGPTSADSAATARVAANPARCSNVFTGTRGSDKLGGTSGGDRILGLAGNDVVSGGPGADCIDGGPGNDRVSGGSGNDNLIGGRGNDKVSGGKGKDKITAGSGNDVINVADGQRDVVNCGKGNDRVRADRKDKLRGCEHVTFVTRKRLG